MSPTFSFNLSNLIHKICILKVAGCKKSGQKLQEEKLLRKKP